MSMIEEEERPLPLIVCLNKQDLPSAVHEDRIRTHLKIPASVPVFMSVAREGHNIMEAFQYLFQSAMRASVLAQPIS
jgi:signal recognition particle receptor subunit beta